MLGPLAALVAAACAPEPPCGLRACDIRAADCQVMAAEAAACLREVPSVSVPVVVVARDAYTASVTSAPLTADEEEAFRRGTPASRRSAWRPPTTLPPRTAFRASQLGAFYTSATPQITIIDDGYPLDSLFLVALLVHENMHAIQHARFHLADLRAARATDLDRALALGAVSEGEATYVQDLAVAGFYGLGKDDIDWPAVLARWQESARRQARGSRWPVSLAWSHFRYPFGTGYVKEAYDASGWSGVDALYGMPPVDTRQVMAGFGAAAPGGGAWAEDLDGDSIPVLDPGSIRLRRGGASGAWLLYAFLNRYPLYPHGVEDLPTLLTARAFDLPRSGHRRRRRFLAAAVRGGYRLPFARREGPHASHVAFHVRGDGRCHRRRLGCGDARRDPHRDALPADPTGARHGAARRAARRLRLRPARGRREHAVKRATVAAAASALALVPAAGHATYSIVAADSLTGRSAARSRRASGRRAWALSIARR